MIQEALKFIGPGVYQGVDDGRMGIVEAHPANQAEAFTPMDRNAELGGGQDDIGIVIGCILDDMTH